VLIQLGLEQLHHPVMARNTADVLDQHIGRGRS
jgi:hypothetical protein